MNHCVKCTSPRVSVTSHSTKCYACGFKQITNQTLWEKEKIRQREYYQRPEIKTKRKAYQQRPENKARQKAYYQKPEFKAKKKAYEQRPDIKARIKAHRIKKRIQSLQRRLLQAQNEAAQLKKEAIE